MAADLAALARIPHRLSTAAAHLGLLTGVLQKEPHCRDAEQTEIEILRRKTEATDFTDYTG